jgi:acetyl-CoA acetyltransferase
MSEIRKWLEAIGLVQYGEAFRVKDLKETKTLLEELNA